MEPFRLKDSVTAEYDLRHRRPGDYRNILDMQVAEEFNEASPEKPPPNSTWKLPRDQALVAGWQPSGVSKGDWRDHREQRKVQAHV